MLTEKNDVKTLFMITLSHIGEAFSDSLMSAILETKITNITSLTDAVEELIEDELIVLEKANGKTEKICRLTQKGTIILPELESFLSPGIAETAKRDTRRFYDEIISGTEYFSKLKKGTDGFTLTCTQTEKRITVCEINLFFEDEKSAVLAQKNFEMRPKAVINAVKAAITGNVDFII